MDLGQLNDLIGIGECRAPAVHDHVGHQHMEFPCGYATPAFKIVGELPPHDASSPMNHGHQAYHVQCNGHLKELLVGGLTK